MKIGIIGAGFVARAVAKLAIKAGHTVMLSNSRGPQTLFSQRVMIGCEAGTVSEAVQYGDIVILAVPLNAIAEVKSDALSGKPVFDAVNYYVERDGQVDVLDTRQITTSELVARYLPRAKITKAFNAIPMPQLESEGLSAGDPNRRALPIAGDDEAGKEIARELYDAFGFDTVDAGSLAEGWRFERGMPAYCVRLTKAQLAGTLRDTQRQVEPAP